MDENKHVEEIAEDTNPSPNPAQVSPTGTSTLPIILGGLVALILIIVGLFLPPISLGERLGFGGSEDTVAETTADSATTSSPEIPGEISVSGSSGVLTRVPIAEFNAASSLPGDASAKSAVYQLEGGGAGHATVTVPGGVTAADDLFGWDGQGWHFIPSQVSSSGQELISAEGQLPQALVVVERSEPEALVIAANVQPEQALPSDVLPLLTHVNVGGYMLGNNAELSGTPAETPQGPYSQLLHVTNVGAIVDQTAVTELLADADMRTSHMQVLLNEVAAGNYAGINLDYQGIVDSQSEAFTLFVTDLANNLHSQGKVIALTMATPIKNADGSWSTSGQNLAVLGDVVDMIYLQMPLDPTTYGDGGEAEQLLAWATRQVDRSKLIALVSANAVDLLGSALREVTLENALTRLGEVTLVSSETTVDINTPVELAFEGEATPLEWDGESLTYKFSYESDGQTRTVWIANEASLAHRLRLAKRYGLGGAAVYGLSGMEVAANYVAALESYIASADMPQPVGAAIVWTVENEDGGVIASSSGEALDFAWEGTETSGNYVIKAGFAQGNTTVDLSTIEVTIGEAEVVAEEPTAAADESPEAAADEETATEETETEETLEVATGATGNPNATVNLAANVRTGPGIAYATVGEGAQPGTKVEVIGRTSDNSWFNIILPDEEEAWIFGQLITIDSSVDIAALPVPQVAAAPVAAAPSGGGGGAAAPAPVAAAANLGGGFELGGQTHTLANPQLMQYAGMKWVKFQHKWGCGNNPGDLAGRIGQAQANGFKVLLSIPGSPYPSSIDFQCYVDFLGGVAAQGPNAIEVWNEMNIDFEWPAGQIDPTSYVNNMLAPAYNAIKSANPNVMVISGAPAPTGFFGGGCGTNGCDDSAYLAGMAAAGAARYMDCMGAHFNAGATPPAQSSGHPAGNDHYSWHLQPMINLYYGALGKPVCFTELGYLSGEDYGGLPSRFSWAGGTTVGQHAQWLAEAVSISANSGKVRMVIVFNVDFTTFGDDPQAGYAMIRKNGSCPACETLRQVMGGG